MAENKRMQRTGRKKVAALKMDEENRKLEEKVNKNHIRKKRSHLRIVKEKNKQAGKTKSIIVLIILITLVSAFLYFNAKAPTGLIEWIRGDISVSGSGGGFPQNVPGNLLKNIYTKDNQLLVLTDTSVVDYNLNGKQIFNRQHGYAAPVVSSSKSRTLIYDRAGKAYKIENPDRTLFIGKFETLITTGSIGDNGTYAFVNRSKEFTVFSKDFKPIYKWSSAEMILGNITVSPTGKNVAVAAVTAYNAEYKSELLIFNISKTQPINKIEFKKELILSVDYIDKNNIAIVTDKRFTRVKSDGSGRIDYLFGERKLINTLFEPKIGTLICLSSNNDTQKNEINVFSNDGVTKCSFNFDKKLVNACISKDKVYILSQNNLFTYNYAGKMLKSYDLSTDASKVKSIDDGVAVLFSESINIFR